MRPTLKTLQKPHIDEIDDATYLYTTVVADAAACAGNGPHGSRDIETQVQSGVPVARALHSAGLELQVVRGLLRAGGWSTDAALMTVLVDCCHGAHMLMIWRLQLSLANC